MAQQVYDPGHGNANQRQDAQAHQLHEFVGNGSAGITQIVLCDLVGRMIERRVFH